MNEVTKPNIEVITPEEIYLTDLEGRRTKRICGAEREGIPKEFPCVEAAGLDTRHPGIGRCAKHDILAIKINPKSTYGLISKSKTPSTLLDYLDQALSIDPIHSTSFDTEIALLQGILTMMIDTLGENPSVKRLDEIGKQAERLAKLKQIKMDSARRAQLDFKVVGRLVKGIFIAIKMHTSPEASKRIISDILTSTINPMMISGDIGVGDIGELKDIAKKTPAELVRETIDG